MSRIIIFGIGRGANVATRYFSDDSPHEIVAYTVDDEYAGKKEFMGRPVIPFSRIEKELPPAESEMFILLGFQRMNALRAEKFATAKRKGYTLASYVNSRVLASGKPEIGENCFILEGNVFNYDTSIGDNVVMWSSNHVGDMSIVEDNVFISSQVVLSGEVIIGANSFLGVNATISNHVRVGARSYIGANTLITQDTTPDSVYIAKAATRLDGMDSLRFLQVINREPL
jgi:sugar O-acyltransferase (sialic acid O-acetyltransferase NeuD family)